MQSILDPGYVKSTETKQTYLAAEIVIHQKVNQIPSHESHAYTYIHTHAHTHIYIYIYTHTDVHILVQL